MHMRIRRTLRVASALLAVLSLTGCLSIQNGEPEAPAWRQVWADEFDGTMLNAEHWVIEEGNGFYSDDQWVEGWGNGELQYYSTDEEHVRIADGMLILQAHKEQYEGMAGEEIRTFNYTSGKVLTRTKASWQYGRFEIRAQFPSGKGLWPAIWMLPEEEYYGSWAASGEIDIVEGWGSTPYKVAGTIHYGGVWPGNTHSGSHYFFPESATDTSEFHVYAIEWVPGEIRWYVDDVLYQTKDRWYSESIDYPAPFDRPFYLIMNLAVGGHFDGNPISSTPFPAEMVIDYVRVYELDEYPPVSYTREREELPEQAVAAASDGNLVENGDFAAGTDSWVFLELPQFKGDGELITDGEEAAIEVFDPGDVPYSIQLIQRVPLVKGHTYRLEFTAKAESRRMMQVKLNGDETRSWIHYSPVRSVDLSEDEQRYSMEFIMRSGTDLQARLEFNAGAQWGRVTLDDVRLSLVD
jgi:beta-glucanase (GH16 family)